MDQMTFVLFQLNQQKKAEPIYAVPQKLKDQDISVVEATQEPIKTPRNKAKKKSTDVINKELAQEKYL